MSGRQAWPDTLRVIAELIGDELALRLAAAEGGLDRVYVPKAPTPDHPWALAVGPEAWALLVERFGGERVDLPRGFYLELKKITIWELSEQGLSHRQIARQCKVTERYVRKTLGPAAEKIDPRQAALPFDE